MELQLLARITLESGKRSGRPCIRGMRITVGDILGWLAEGKTEAEILDDFPYLEAQDIRAALLYAFLKENQSLTVNPLMA